MESCRLDIANQKCSYRLGHAAEGLHTALHTLHTVHNKRPVEHCTIGIKPGQPTTLNLQSMILKFYIWLHIFVSVNQVRSFWVYFALLYSTVLYYNVMYSTLLQSIHCIHCTVLTFRHITVLYCTEQCTLYSFYIVQCTLYCTEQCTLYSVYSVQ